MKLITLGSERVNCQLPLHEMFLAVNPELRFGSFFQVNTAVICQVGVVLYRRKHSQDTELTKLRSVLSVHFSVRYCQLFTLVL